MTTLAQFEVLAKAAKCTNDDDWGSERQTNAHNKFFDEAEKQFPGHFGDRFNSKLVAMHCTSDECVDEGMIKLKTLFSHVTEHADKHPARALVEEVAPEAIAEEAVDKQTGIILNLMVTRQDGADEDDAIYDGGADIDINIPKGVSIGLACIEARKAFVNELKRQGAKIVSVDTFN